MLRPHYNDFGIYPIYNSGCTEVQYINLNDIYRIQYINNAQVDRHKGWTSFFKIWWTLSLWNNNKYSEYESTTNIVNLCDSLKVVPTLNYQDLTRS